MTMRTLPNIGVDELVTRYELEFTQREVVKILGKQLVGKQLFANGINGGGWDGGPGKKNYNYYKEVDQDEALISMEGTTQANSKSMRELATVKVPAITQSWTIQWRDLETAKSEGFDLLSFHAIAAARKIAEAEDMMMVTGEHTGFECYGVEGLATATTINTVAGGAWPANAIDNVLAAAAALQTDGFHDLPVLVAGSVLIKCIKDEKNAASDFSMLRYLLDNDIISGVVESSHLRTAAGVEDTTALLVDPDPNYLYYVEGQAPKLTVKLDKHDDLFCMLRETIAPVIARPECICSITGLSCA